MISDIFTGYYYTPTRQMRVVLDDSVDSKLAHIGIIKTRFFVLAAGIRWRMVMADIILLFSLEAVSFVRQD